MDINEDNDEDNYIYLFILDPVGPMIQRHIQEKVHAFVTTSSSSRSITQSCVAHRPTESP